MRLGDASQSLGYTKSYETVQIVEGGEVHNILVPIDAQTKLLKAEFDKGVRAGMLLVADWPRAFEEAFDAEAKKLREEIESEKETNDDEDD